ncbi:MAG: TolC family protein [Magnetococcales bacterium]|nr:TolC family protein [Magnetococcales bacterium]
MPPSSFQHYCALCNRCFRPVVRWTSGRGLPKRPVAGRRVGLRLVLAGGSLLGLLACTIAPNPLTTEELTAVLQADQQAVRAAQEPVSQPIDLYEAVARAIKYNLDYRVHLLEKTVALTEVDLSNYDLLPRLAAKAGFDSRSSVEAASGYSLTTETSSAGYSTSQDRDKQYADLGLVWNVLDFGVSYFQAKQAADRVLVAEENRRKLAHSQFQEVQSAYWRAASAQQLQGRIEPVLKEARVALAVAHQVEKERLRPQLEMMRFQRELLEVVQQLETLREELALAKKNLALLINLPPGTDFELNIPPENSLTVTPIRATVAEMEQLALMNRPELRMELYKSRISAAETRKALLRMLPGLEFKTASHYDSNSFAMDSNWQDAGLQVTGNLMKLVAGPTAIRLADNQAILSQLRRVALNMAILSQVHISYRKYQDANRRLESFSNISAVDQRIQENLALDAGSTNQNRLEQIRAATRAIMSQLQRNKAYAELQNAIGMIFVSLGVDLLPTASQEAPLPLLSQSIRESVMAWQEGISLPPRMETPADGLAAGRLNPTADQALNREMESLFTPPDRKSGRHSPVLPATQAAQKPTVAPDNIPKQAEIDALVRQAMAAMDKQSAVDRQPAADKQPAVAVQPTVAVQPPPVAAVRNAQPEPAAPPPPAARQNKPSRESTEGEQSLIEEGEATAQPVPSRTPANSLSAAAPAPPPAPPVRLEEAVRTMVKEWADAWARQDAQSFLTFYSEQFLPENGWNRTQWMEAYTTLLNPATRVQVNLAEVAIEVASDSQATAFVRIVFNTANERWEKRKTLQLRKEEKYWRIVAEKTDDRPTARLSALSPAAQPTGEQR